MSAELPRWSKLPKVIWLEPHRVQARERVRAASLVPTEDELAQCLMELPQGPTKWIIDDAWAPSILLRDILEAPTGTEARDQFLRWRYSQHLALEAPQSVQAMPVGETSFLLVGMPQELRDLWLQLALKLGRPIHALVPRWLWIYNRLAPQQNAPGMLLSLGPGLRPGTYTGTLAAWSHTLAVLRQWWEPASADVWMEERVGPTATFLLRENVTPQQLLVWGAPEWPESPFPLQLLPREIPAQEGM